MFLFLGWLLSNSKNCGVVFKFQISNVMPVTISFNQSVVIKNAYIINDLLKVMSLNVYWCYLTVWHRHRLTYYSSIYFSSKTCRCPVCQQQMAVINSDQTPNIATDNVNVYNIEIYGGMITNMLKLGTWPTKLSNA